MYKITIFALIPLALGLYVTDNGPPPVRNTALMARYIMHKIDYVSLSTISIQDDIKGYPFATIKSTSDGPETNSTGVPYLYMTPMELSEHDLEKDNRCTLLATLSQTGYCVKQNYDPQDPRCAKTILSGKIVKVSNDSSEYAFAQSALFERHPEMKSWPVGHGFFVSKIAIEQIEVIDFFGQVAKVTVEDYFNADPNSEAE